MTHDVSYRLQERVVVISRVFIEILIPNFELFYFTYINIKFFVKSEK